MSREALPLNSSTGLLNSNEMQITYLTFCSNVSLSEHICPLLSEHIFSGKIPHFLGLRKKTQGVDDTYLREREWRRAQ